MPEHPCSKGLTPECFKAYPRWARQALAYKVLHAILPKQLSKNLPGRLNKALIGSGTIVPAGLPLEPGMVIPPNFTWPMGWNVGDPLPPGVSYMTELPQIQTEGAPGPSPPIFVGIYEPGRFRGPVFLQGAPESEILEYMNTPDYVKAFGDSDESYRIATVYGTIKSAKVTDLYIMMDKIGDPLDNITVELRENEGNIEPGAIITGGVSNPINGGDIPLPAPQQYWIHFVFPDKPEISRFYLHCFSLARSDVPDPVNYYEVALRADISGYTWYGTLDGRWPNQEGAFLNYELWGIPTE